MREPARAETAAARSADPSGAIDACAVTPGASPCKPFGTMRGAVTKKKESQAHSPAMNATPRRSPADRDHAIARLRHLTIGTTIASVAAVGAFGAVAALSYSGGISNITTAAVTTTA